MDQRRIDQIVSSYEQHPLNAAAILQRIQRDRGNIEMICEIDLAIDESTFITDQNHTGGYATALSLGRTLNLTTASRILDVGTGLGGTIRVLADVFKCHCHGTELATCRYEDAIQLTALVGLEQLCSFSQGDFLTLEFSTSPFDVVIGQDTFMHFPDQRQLLRRCVELLKEDGWLAIDDGYLRRPAVTADETRQLENSWRHWNGTFHSLPEWWRDLQGVGMCVLSVTDQTELALREYEVRLASQSCEVSPREKEGWQLGYDLMQKGVLGTMRLLCQKTLLREIGIPLIFGTDGHSR